MIKQAYSRMFSLLFIAFFLLCAGCDGTPSSVTPAPPATAAPTPDTTFTPARTPAGIATPTPSPSPDGYDSTELDGIAAPGETLPAYASYEEARQASIDARGGTCEVVGWITIPNTVIDYPVYLNETDEAYYLDHNSEGEVSKYGAIFMDTRNADSTQQQHVLIYGHDMRNGTMFHDLANYKQKAFSMKTVISRCSGTMLKPSGRFTLLPPSQTTLCGLPGRVFKAGITLPNSWRT